MRYIELQPPVGGINKATAFQSQPPFSSPDCLNVRTSRTQEGRMRIGRRPGLRVSQFVTVPGPVRGMKQVTIQTDTARVRSNLVNPVGFFSKEWPEQLLSGVTFSSGRLDIAWSQFQSEVDNEFGAVFTYAGVEPEDTWYLTATFPPAQDYTQFYTLFLDYKDDFGSISNPHDGTDYVANRGIKLFVFSLQNQTRVYCRAESVLDEALLVASHNPILPVDIPAIGEVTLTATVDLDGGLVAMTVTVGNASHNFFFTPTSNWTPRRIAVMTGIATASPGQTSYFRDVQLTGTAKGSSLAPQDTELSIIKRTIVSSNLPTLIDETFTGSLWEIEANANDSSTVYYQYAVDTKVPIDPTRPYAVELDVAGGVTTSQTGYGRVYYISLGCYNVSNVWSRPQTVSITAKGQSNNTLLSINVFGSNVAFTTQSPLSNSQTATGQGAAKIRFSINPQTNVATLTYTVNASGDVKTWEWSGWQRVNPDYVGIGQGIESPSIGETNFISAMKINGVLADQIDLARSSVQTFRSIMTVTGGGEFWAQDESAYYESISTSNSGSLSSENMIQMAERLGRLYIADWSNAKVKQVGALVYDNGNRVAFQYDTVSKWSTLGITNGADRLRLSDVTGTVIGGTYAITSKTDAEEDTVDVSDITRIDQTATVTAANHGFSDGDAVEITGASPSRYNGLFVVANATTNTFDVTVPDTLPAQATGSSIKVRRAAFIVLLGASAGSGTAKAEVFPTPKYFDASFRTLNQWVATTGKGDVPIGCPLICVYRDRIVLAGNPAHVWYMSRQGDPFDWDYGADANDVQRAVAGTNTAAGVLGDSITALIPFMDDYLMFGCLNSIFVLRGDPAFDGQIDLVSSNVGILPGKAWCLSPRGEVIFLSSTGLYATTPDQSVRPTPISKYRIPVELRDVDAANNVVLLEYDVEHDGVQIWITPNNSGNTTAIHYWFDWDQKAFWPFRTALSAQEATAITYFNNVRNPDGVTEFGVLIGGRDGNPRVFDPNAINDDTTGFPSYVDYGPMRFGGVMQDGLLQEINATLSEISGTVDYQVRGADSAEAAQKSTAVRASGVMVPGWNRVFRPRVQAYAHVLRLKQDAINCSPWSVEQIVLGTDSRARRRV